jgi:hypothetical protein
MGMDDMTREARLVIHFGQDSILYLWSSLSPYAE